MKQIRQLVPQSLRMIAATMTLAIALASSLHPTAVLAQAATPTPGQNPKQISGSALPPGTGRDLVESRCASCHALDIIPSHPHNPDEWADVLDKMVQRGAKASDTELDLIQDYLSKNFSTQ